MENNYTAQQIKVLTGLSAVRKRPAMYIGNISIEGLHHLINEVVDNSIDEALAGYCSRIDITINEEGSITIEDDGRGIPVDIHPVEGVPALELVMTRLHAGGKFDHQTYKVSGGLHGVGVSVVNALSESLTVEVYRDGFIYSQSYNRGEPSSPVEVKGETNKRGTRVTFRPDPEIFQETTEFQYEIIQARMREIAYLNPTVKITLKDERSGKEGEFHYKGGLISFVEFLNKNKEIIHDPPIFIHEEKDQVQVEIAFQYNSGYSEKLLSYVNNIRTKDGGTHEAGFRQAITKCINRYASEDIVPKKLKEKMEGDDVREGLFGIISVRVPNPQFEGQTKTKLGNSEVRSIVSSIVYESLSTYLEENPSVSKKILTKVVEAARAREAARKAKEIARKSSSGQDMFMAGKLAECQEKRPELREIFIVEGDSAGGSAKQGRDRKFQAILPLRGKIMNVEKARYDKMLASEEIRNLIAAIGTGIGMDDFDISKIRYHKIVIMTDADVDGAHIRTLLLTFFFRQMPALIESGMLYVAQPPLYRISMGRGKEIYLKDDEEMDNFLFERTVQRVSVRPEGWDNALKENKLKETLLDLASYEKAVNEMEKRGVWKELARDLMEIGLLSLPQLHELQAVEEFAEKLKEKGYRTGRVKPASRELSGYEFDVGVKELAYLTVKIGPELLHLPEFRRLVKAYKKLEEIMGISWDVEIGEENHRMNDPFLLLEFLRSQGRKGLNIQRYKGLGEMNPIQLWETTMDPAKRTLLQISIRDANEAEDMFSTLMGEKIELRRDFIYSHALEVQELDI